MEWLLIGVARVLLPLIQRLPLEWVARVGRAGGQLAWVLDRRHRRVALNNLQQCLGRDVPFEDLEALARENFRRLGENYATGIRAMTLPWEVLRRHVEFAGVEILGDLLQRHPGKSILVALGHFGNFELLAWLRMALPGVQMATTYRALRQRVATRLLLELRSRSGCLFFERRRDARELRQVLRTRQVVLGLMADQHDGRGVRVPFLGHDAGTSTAPALFAQRYGCPLVTLYCFRVGLARWRIEVGEEIPTRTPDGARRSLEAIAVDMNRLFETAIRRDPANWFWVHRRWKPAAGAASAPVMASA